MTSVTATNLLQFDGVVIQQQVETLKVITKIDSVNRYCVYEMKWNGDAKQKPVVLEDKPAFLIHEFLNTNNDLSLKRDGTTYELELYKYQEGESCVARVSRKEKKPASIGVYDEQDNYIGKIQWEKSDLVSMYSNLEIRNGLDSKEYTVQIAKVPGFNSLPIMAKDKKVGEVCKLWGGFVREMFTDADRFQLLFPKAASVQQRLLLIAAVLFIDFSWYES
eukprot:TRINITY_DN15719_c0_g1_i1.p1 TRINITY_DN15719_c0_g1~~TRINITY_DN15719_c0_g1_i1.p1  ORF type:complete len:220 (-),score=44.21 TRINITY_DN15719_c0_g1_i1:147-806(-)